MAAATLGLGHLSKSLRHTADLIDEVLNGAPRPEVYDADSVRRVTQAIRHVRKRNTKKRNPWNKGRKWTAAQHKKFAATAARKREQRAS